MSGSLPAGRPQRGTVALILLGLLIGVLLGGAIGWFAARAIPQGAPDAGPAPLAGAGQPRATGHFIQANPADRDHYGAGTLTLYSNRLELGADFAVGPGPKYHLYLVPQRGIDADTRVEETLFVDLGPLKAFAGAQTYPLPAGLDLTDYGTVAVWCEQFNTLISPAELVFGPARP